MKNNSTNDNIKNLSQEEKLNMLRFIWTKDDIVPVKPKKKNSDKKNSK